MTKDIDYSKNVEPEQDEDALEEGRSFAVEDNDTSGYIGVSPEYMTYANETEKPITLDEEREALEAADAGDQDNPAVPPVDAEPDEDPEPEENDDKGQGNDTATPVATGSTTPAAPPA